MGIAQAGLIRRKNALSMLMQILSGMAIGSLLFFAVGFSLTFGPSQGGFIGNLEYAFFSKIDAHSCLPASVTSADTIPGLLFGGFQMMFALMTPLIVTGSWSEKMTFKAFLVFVVIWPLLVYYPLAHWIWNVNGWLNQRGMQDFAGGIVIHASSGVAGFVISFMLQRRKSSAHISHHSMPLTVIGCALIWCGWYSFNAGSSLKSNFQAGLALLNTHIAACTGALIWSLLTYWREGVWRVSEFMNGSHITCACLSTYLPVYLSKMLLHIPYYLSV
jgi:Amt family ammonium transporter